MKIILASHGALAKGMKDTLDMIVGNQVSIQSYSAYDEENVDFASDISQQITREVNEQFIIVTDVMGGSVNNAMTELVLRYKNVFFDNWDEFASSTIISNLFRRLRFKGT